MAAASHQLTHREKISMVVDRAGTRYTTVVAVIMLGGPIAAYLWGDPSLMFYTHITIGAFWFGLDFFFKYVMLPAFDEVDPATIGQVVPHLTPKIMVMADALTLGTIGSGLGLATLFGYWGNPEIQPFLWAAVGIAALMFLNAFIPLHVYQADLTAELLSDEPDPERVEHLNGRAELFGFLMTIFMLLILGTMTGMRMGGF